jgi:hypothetical protein
MYLYFGSLRGASPDLNSNVTTLQDIRIIGAFSGDRAGSIMDMGDLNNDGKLELAIGIPGSDSKNQIRSDAGEVVIIYGFGQLVPARLQTIDAVADANGGAFVTWSAMQPDQFAGFNVYRKVGAGAYELASSQMIPAESGSEGSYSFLDESVHAGVIGYEIRQVDMRGNEVVIGSVAFGANSGTVSTQFAISRITSPFVGSTTMQLALPSRLAGQDYRVALYDNAGRLVRSVASGKVAGGSLDVSIDGSNLRAGVYHVLVTAGAERLNSKLIKI